MDTTIFLELVKTNLFSDLMLILHDGVNDDIILNVHKNILFVSNIYFRKLLTNCKEKFANKITITVPNVLVTNDIIMSFYGQPFDKTKLLQWSYFFAYYKCTDFLCIASDKNFIK